MLSRTGGRLHVVNLMSLFEVLQWRRVPKNVLLSIALIQVHAATTTLQMLVHPVQASQQVLVLATCVNCAKLDLMLACNFLATQTKAGSGKCNFRKEALHDAFCLGKCNICSRGGIPDWCATLNVNRNSMTCLELDDILIKQQIENNSN